MKKQLFSILAVAATLILGFSSCSKDDPATPINLDKTTTAYVKGYLSYQPDLTASVLNAYPSSSDVVLSATVEYSSLSGLASAGSFEVPTAYDQSTGMYTIEVPASTNATGVKIIFSGFSGTQRQTATTTVKGYWTPSSPVVYQSVTYGQTLVGPTIAYSIVPAPVQ